MATKRSSDKLAVTGSAAAVPARRTTSTQARTRKKLPAAQSVINTPAPVAQTVTFEEPSYEAVAALAYGYWETRGYQGGSAEQDWLRAELEIRAVK